MKFEEERNPLRAGTVEACPNSEVTSAGQSSKGSGSVDSCDAEIVIGFKAHLFNVIDDEYFRETQRLLSEPADLDYINEHVRSSEVSIGLIQVDCYTALEQFTCDACEYQRARIVCARDQAIEGIRRSAMRLRAMLDREAAQ